MGRYRDISVRSRGRARGGAERLLMLRILSAAAMAGLASVPYAAFASSITNGQGTSYQETGAGSGVYDVMAQRVYTPGTGDSYAVNRFKDFKIDRNNTANLYFHTKENASVEAADLINFVDSRIDVNGTVNAIRNNRIGGNLYFLSPDGMAVGSGGVINTGSLYVMTPAVKAVAGEESSYSDLRDHFVKEALSSSDVERIRTGDMTIPLNAAGTITVLGRIHAVGDVKMYAPKIGVGKNVSGVEIDGTAADGIVKAASIQTGVTDFSSLVSLTEEEQASAVLTNLQAEAQGNGDIVLAAKAEYSNSTDQMITEFAQKANVTGSVPRMVTASVDSEGTLDAKGNLQLTAEATNGNLDLARKLAADDVAAGKKFAGDSVQADDASGIAKTYAGVSIGGSVTAGNAVTLRAEANNTYIDNGKTVADKISNAIGMVIPVSVDAGVLNNEAAVTIGKDASVTGKTVAAEAKAVVEAGVGAESSAMLIPSSSPTPIPAFAATYAKVTNNAGVTVDGSVRASGADTDTNAAVHVAASAKSNTTNTATVSQTDSAKGIILESGTSNVAAALAVTKHENNARVNLNGTIEAEAGSVKAESDVLNQLTASAKSEGSDQYVLGAAVDVFLHDSTASIDQQGTIRANKDVQLLSTNTMDKNNHTGAITLGANKYDSGFMKAADYAGIGEEIKKLPGVGSMISQTIGIFKEGGTGEGSIGETLAKTFNTGAGVLVADEKDTSSVNFGRNSTTIASAGNLTAKADTVTKDTVMKGSAASNSFDNGDGSTKKAVVSAGVAYASMNQQALVTVEDGKDRKNAVLTAGGDLTLKSNDSMEYNRIERLKKKLDSSIAQLEFAISLLDQVPEAPSLDLGTKSEGLLGDLKKFRDNFSEKTADISPESLAQDSAWSLIGDLADQAMTLQEKEQEVSSAFDQITGLDKIKAILGNTSTVIDNALAFTKPVSYGNVSASASSKGGKDTKISFAGAVSIMDFDYTSHVTVRKNASLSAGKNLNLSSVENIKDVIVTGKNKFWKNDAAAGDGPGIGGSFNYQMFDSSALVQVDAGAELTAGDMNLSSSSDIFHVGAMLSAGKAGGSPISGMGSVTNGSSKNEILVDKDARLTASRDSTSGGMITLSGHNNTNVNNAILAFSAGHETAAAGISVAVNHLNVINRADIMDLDNAYIPAESGFFRASAMNLSAETTGLINAITVAGGLTSSGERAEEDQSIFDKLGNGIDKMVDFPDNVDKKIFEAVSAVSSMTKNIIGTFNESGASQGGTQTASQSTSKSAPSFSLGGAGSVSVNLTNDTTEAIVDGAKVELDHDGNIQAGARDTSFIGAWSGAAAMSVRKGDSSGRTAAIGGAAGANDIDNTVTAAIKNSTLTGVKNMNVEALSGGTAIAAGLGEALTSSDQEGSSFAGGAAVSVSLINKNVTALAENDNVTGAGTGADEKADIKVAAYESDIEGTGGGNIDAALGDGTVVGGGIAVARLNNQINAAIRGGSYTNIGSSSTEALLAAKQVTAALSTGIAAGSGSGSKGAFTGAILYNRLINHVDASLSGTEKFEADSVSVLAHDTSAGSAEAEYFQNKLGDYKKHQAFAEAAGIDTDGSSFYKDKDGNSTLETSGETADMDDKGSLSVGAALVIAGSSGNAAGAAVNVSDRDIDFSARIDSASIDASSISVNAEADTLGVDVSAGIAAGTDDFGGAGSVVWQTEDNDILAQAADSNLKTDKLSITASGNAREINAAGTVGYGKTIGLGASLSYNKLSNEIHAYLAGGTLMKHSTGGTIDLDVLAENQGKLYAFGANAAVSSDAEGLGALSGVVAANHGGTDTEAVIGEAEDSEGQVSSREKTSLSDVSDASVRAESRGMRLAVVGNVDASMGKAAIGGAVAYNDVGGAGTGKAGQKTRAAIVNASLASSDGGKVSVQAKDASTLTTVAVGIGGAKTAAIEGAAATALVNKAITSEIKNSEMKAASGRMQETSVSSESGSKIVTTAVAGAGSGTASVGAGVSVNRIKQDTKAGIEGSQITDRNTLVEATGNSSITSIGIGAAAAGNAGIAGNVAVNKIGNDVDAEVLGSTISSTGNISVLANGRENLGNYAGALGISAGKGGAGVGVSVSYNEITGSTDSLISGSTLTADGSEEESTSLTQSMDKDGIKTEASVDGKTVSDKRKGVIAASYGQHDLQSVSITGGIAAGGSAGVGAAGTVTINKIGGETKAVVTNTAVNETLVSGTSNDVTVQAKDRTNSESHTGSLSLGVGSTAGVGIAGASDTLVFDRTTQAELSGDLTSQAKKKVNGRMIDVQADQVSNILTNADGVAISAGGSAAVSGAATVAVTKLSGTAKALMQQISSTNNGLSIHAVHDHHTTLVSASGAVGAGAAGAALGAGIGVVNDNFTTAAILSDSENTSRALAGTSSSGGASVKADSSTAITTAVVGAAASLGGASLGAGVTVAVNNVNSTTSAETNRSTVQADDAFAVDAHNHVKTDFHSVEASVGMAAIGAGVGINTIGTGTAARVTDSTITAKSVDTKSREELDINQNMIGATAGGLGVNANVMITTIGTKAAPTYGTSGQNNASFDTDEILSKANGSLDAQNGNLEKQSDLIGSNAGVTLTNDSTITASAGNDAAAGTQTVITGTHQTALDGSVTVSADRETNAHIKSDSATLSAGSLSATVAVLDAKKDAGVSVDGSVLEASKDVSITALQHGETAVNSYQANLALAGTISAAYAKNKSNGATRADVASSHIKGIDTTILAEDTGSTTSGVYGISGALLFSGGALITNTENTSSTDVSLTGGSVISSTGEANITSRKANTVSADALGGSVGAAALQGIVAEAKDSGNSTITVTGENQVSGTAVSLLAEESPRVRAEARAYNGALLGAGGASIAKADASGTVSLTVGDGSLFKGDSVSMNAAVWEQNDGTSTFDTAHAEAVGVSGALLGSCQANTSEASQETQVLMDIGNSTYYADNLTIIGSNSSVLHSLASGVSVGGAIAKGENISRMSGTKTTHVAAKGARDGSSLGTVTIRSNAYNNLSGNASGSGGGIVNVSDTAAASDTRLATDTKNTISGDWKALLFTASATNSDDISTTADSLSAAVIGASGTDVKTNISHAAAIDVTGNIETTGGQTYRAVNSVNHDVKLLGNGYGAVSINSNTMDNTLSYKTSVNLHNASLSSEDGSLAVLARTEGKMNYKNQMKSAGAIPSTNAHSTNTLTYDNSVLASDVTMRTFSEDQDIVLAATDNTDATFATLADTQGGAVGVASAVTENTLSRSNTTSFTGGLLESTNDAGLYAGSDADGISSSLDYNITADAYNKTAVPIHTKPSVSNTMSQANHVLVDGTIRSVRHTNLKADEGLTTVAESAVEYNNYTKDGGQGSITSTANGKRNSHETTDNYVEIGAAGSVLAGIHTDLDLLIEGNAEYNANGEIVQENGEATVVPTFNLDNIYASVKDGQDWFNPGDITIGRVTLHNDLMARYLDISAKKGQYDPESKEAKGLDQELDDIIELMKINGFVKNDSIIDEMEVAAITLPAIVVSGGNVNIEADKVKGSGSITAQGANSVNVTSTSNLYLKTDDIVIKDKGGEIRYKGGVIANGEALSEFAGSVSSSSADGAEPSITITSKGSQLKAPLPDDPSKTITVTTPDIGIFGAIRNASGDVSINNSNGSILVDSKAVVSGRNIKLHTDHGAVSQISDGWNLVGSDPVTHWQFSDSIAEKIQQYLTKAANLGWNVSWLTSQGNYDAYKANLLAYGAKELNLTPGELDTIRNASDKAERGIVAEKDVYLSGKNVIINGLIQSGYGTYKTVLTSADKARVNDIEKRWKKNMQALTDERVLSNSDYIVNEGGSYYNAESGQWEYEVKIYYNPDTGRLLAENLEPVGGGIYITGAIASTNGSGRLLAMDGTPDISIDTTAVDKELMLNTIENHRLGGRISIQDTALNTKTVLTTSDGIINTSVSAIDGSEASQNRITGSGSTVLYKPAEQLLNWTGGISGSSTGVDYQYSKKFLAWGFLPYAKSNTFINDASVSGGKVQTSSSTTVGDKNLESGQYISMGTQSPLYSSTTTVTQSGETKVTPVVVDKRYKGKWGKVFGYGTAYYTWRETKDTSTSTTYSIKADLPISAGFISGSKDTISIRADKDVFLSGNISSGTPDGTVSLEIQNGGVISDGGARVVTDHLNVSAKDDVFLMHSALGTDARVSLESTNGTSSLYSDKGNLTVTKGHAGGGEFTIQSAGNLKTEGSTAITSDRITLESTKGSIHVIANAAVSPKNSDPLWASINADAAGDIQITNTNGNMRVGHIISHNGNVTLTTNGSFEDATSGGTISSSTDKLQEWEDMGLISDAEDAASRKAAAESARAERWQAIEARGAQLAQSSSHTMENYEAAASAYAEAFAGDADMQAAKTTYEKIVKANPDNQLALDNAYKDFDAARKAFLEGLGYSEETGYTAEERDFIINAGEIKGSDAYGWSRNDLLYAIQNTVLNSKPRDEILTVDSPNVKGNNITLNAGYNIGANAAPVTISYDEINTLENLRILSAADAGDLKWDDDKNTLTIRQQRPLTIQTPGTVTIHSNMNGASGAGSVYLAGVKNTTLNVTGTIHTDADVKLLSDQGIIMNSGSITAHNLIVEGGKGDIGSADNYIETDLAGSLDARTAGNLYIHQMALGAAPVRALTVQSIDAGHVVLDSDAGTVMTTETGKTMGYIDGDIIELKTKDGALGLAADGLRIRNNGGILSAEAKTDGQGIYLSGKESGALKLSEVTAGGDFKIESEGTVDAGVLANEEAGISAVSSTIAADNVSFKTLGAVHLVNGTIETAETGDTSLEASGEITQNTSHTIQSGSLTVKASGGVDMETNTSGTANKFATINLTALAADKDVLIENAHDISTTVNIAEGTTTNSITVTNNSAADSSNVIIHGAGTAETYISINNEKGTIKTDSDLTAKGGSLTLSAKGSVTNEGALAGKDGVSITSAGGTITNKGEVSSSAGSISMETTGNIENDEAVTAKTTASITSSAGTVYNKKAVSGETGVTMSSASALTNDAAVSASSGAISMEATGNIQNSGDVSGKNEIKLNSTGGSLTNSGVVTSSAGNVDMDASGNIENAGAVNAKTTAAITSSSGSIHNSLAVSGETGVTMNAHTTLDNDAGVSAVSGSISMEAIGNITNIGDIGGKDTITMNSAKGNLVNGGSADSLGTGAVSSTAGGIDLDAYGSIQNYEDVTGALSVTMTASNGRLANMNDVTSSGGSITMETPKEAVNQGQVSGRDGVTISGDTADNMDTISSALGGISVSTRSILVNSKDVTAKTTVSLISSEGYLRNKGNVSGEAGVVMDGDTVTNDKDVSASSGSISLTADKNVTQEGALDASGDVSLASETEGYVALHGGLSAGGLAAFTTKDGSIYVGTDTLASDLSAGTTVSMTA